MTADPPVLSSEEIPGRGASMNPFVVVTDAVGIMTFATEVFAAEEVAETRTATPSGPLIHAELRIGDSLLLLADPQPGWPLLPGLFQVWVRDAAAVVDAASRRGAAVVTPPTPFYGALILARIEDPWSNLWWLYQPAPGQPDPTPTWEGGPTTVLDTVDRWMRDRAAR